MSWPNKVYSRSVAKSLSDNTDTTLIASYDGKFTNNSLQDSKGTRNLTASSGASSVRSLVGFMRRSTDGVAGNVAAAFSYPTVNNIPVTGIAIVKSRSAGSEFIINSSNAGNPGWNIVYNPAIGLQVERVNYPTSARYVSGIILPINAVTLVMGKVDTAGGTLSVGVNGIVYTGAPGALFYGVGTGLFIGKQTTATFPWMGDIGSVAIYGAAKSDAWFRAQWVKIAQAAQLKTGWGSKVSIANESTAGNFVGNGSTPFEILSGTWKVSTQTVDGELHKVIECVAAGTVWLDRKFMNINSTEAAYGGWRFFVSHADNALPTTIALTATAKNTPAVTTGYFLRVYNTLTREGTYNAGIYTNFELLGTGGGATEPLEVQVRRRFDNVWQHHNRRIGQAWLTSTSDTEATYLTSEGMSITANAGDWISLGTVRDNFAFTKYFGEFDPSEV
jgi:hypothetical protein